jgi:integrase
LKKKTGLRKSQSDLTSTHNETIEMFFMDWLRCRLQPRVREQTYQGYHDLIVKHILPTLGQIKLQKLTPMQIQQLYDLKRQQQYSPQTILNIHKLLRRVLEDAVYLHHVQYNVCQKVNPPRQPKGHLIIKALSVAETKRFLAAAQGDDLEALYVLAITTGMHQGELLALTWDDIDFTTGKIQVRRSLNRSSQKLDLARKNGVSKLGD